LEYTFAVYGVRASSRSFLDIFATLQNQKISLKPFNARASNNCGIFDHNSPTDRAKKVFEPAKDAESLIISILKM